MAAFSAFKSAIYSSSCVLVSVDIFTDFFGDAFFCSLGVLALSYRAIKLVDVLFVFELATLPLD